LYGLLHHNLSALLVVQCLEALLSGISYPALTLMFKRGLRHDELPTATAMETIIFASQVLLGTGLGVLLFGLIPPLHLLAIDALSLTASATLLLMGTFFFAKQPARQRWLLRSDRNPSGATYRPCKKEAFCCYPRLPLWDPPRWRFYLHWHKK